MKGDQAILEFLNKALRNELTAINQYFLHARMLKNWGYNSFADHEYHESIDEMKHADYLIERILFLEGLPNLQDLGMLRIAQTAPEILQCDLDLELEAIPLLKEAIDVCESKNDYISREIFEKILESEEEHVDWLETRLQLLAEVGEQNFLQSMM